MLTHKTYEGIPADFTLEKAAEWIRPRLSEKRFSHVKGVAKVARELAAEAECDVFLAELAGWLHDCCKETKDRDLVIEALQFGLQLTPLDRVSGSLWHGPVGAETIKRDLEITNEALLDAIREHTLGAVGMSELSKVVFLADCLEASRPADYTDPIWQALRGGDAKKTGKKSKKRQELDLDMAMLVACDLGLAQLIESRRVIHPKTVEVRNYYLDLIRSRPVETP
ncbi:MAG: bis(5'-nucleosyl)-tetraphosphatase (symmetrical) YqeK [Cyanobacteria bacterium SZAS LIN-5]|nr:bis(5'-nucleosyl)-tetraphosphatase (symmetrical) YqeK [Cyanobacteria bacterium SZAS LIN-5]RTL38843.1 MAG: HD domain-containing protein [Candidatus Melainabacteria bacterium]